MLAPRDNPTTTDFVCSCETYVPSAPRLAHYRIYSPCHRYRREGIVAKRTSSDTAQPTRVVCYAIAGIYTPPSKRGHGHGAHMMRVLHWVLAPPTAFPAPFPDAWGAPPPTALQDAAFSVIYSDVRVGCTFYAERCGPVPGVRGWVPRGTESTRWFVDAAETNGYAVDGGTWQWLGADDVERVWSADVRWMQADTLTAANAVEADGKENIVLSFLPDNGVAQFLIQWQMSFTPDMQPVFPLSTWGVQLVSVSEPDGDAPTDADDAPAAAAPTYATWILCPGDMPTLALTRLRAPPALFPKLLRKVMEAARALGAGAIETWNVPAGLREVAAAMGGETYQRDAQFPVLKWYGPEPDEEVKWLFNER